MAAYAGPGGGGADARAARSLRAGRGDELAGNVHIGATSVAGPKRAREGFGPNAHIGAPSVAGIPEAARENSLQCAHRRLFRRVASTDAREIPQQCAHRLHFPRGAQKGARGFQAQCAHWGPIRRWGARRITRECVRLRDGDAGNVHIGAPSVAKTAHYQWFCRRPAHTPHDSVARIGERATDPMVMCTSAALPSRGSGGPARAWSPMCTLGMVPSPGRETPHERFLSNVHISGYSVADPREVATNSEGVCGRPRRRRGQCAHWGRSRREKRTLPAVFSLRDAHSQ